MKRISLVLLLSSGLLVCSAFGARAGQIEDGAAAYNTGNFATALKLWSPLAAQGNAIAQFAVGAMYENGKGVARDYGEALKWYRLAAAQRYAGGQVGLGVMYENGKGVARDYGEALKWYRLAAAQGFAPAQFDVGVMYENGEGVAKDYNEAVRWLRLAAANGDQDAKTALGHIAQAQQTQLSGAQITAVLVVVAAGIIGGLALFHFIRLQRSKTAARTDRDVVTGPTVKADEVVRQLQQEFRSTGNTVPAALETEDRAASPLDSPSMVNLPAGLLDTPMTRRTYAHAILIGDGAERDFVEIAALLGTDANLEEIVNRLREKYRRRMPVADPIAQR